MKRRRTAAPGTGKRSRAHSSTASVLSPFIRENSAPKQSLLHRTLRTTASGHLGATSSFESLRLPTDDETDLLADLVSQQSWENFLDKDNDWITVNESSLSGTQKSNTRAARQEKRVKFLQRYIELRPEILDEILKLEHHGEGAAVCADCKSTSEVLHRCRDCYELRLYCSECIVRRHNFIPLHAIETWKQSFFQRTWLADLGLRIQLGHRGGKCIRPVAAHADFKILHVNGFHHVAVDFCGCGISPDLHLPQLLRARLMPTSFATPRTAVTFECLNLFHILTLQGKISVYDMYLSLVRLTDNRGLDPVIKSRYNECLQVMRIWRNLKMLKRGGRGNDPTGINGTQHGALAVECPACPQPGRNLPENFESDPETSQYLNSLFVAVDANFRLKLKNRKLSDVDLAPSWAYYVDAQEYQNYTNAHASEIEINYCQSNLHAVDHANSSSKSYSYNGVGACKCSRHSMIRPNGVGDLPKGEKYCSMDFILFSGIKNARVPCIKISYDIACQWCKNLRKRMEQYPECIRHDETTHFVYGIPKFHLVGHGPECQTKFSWNFLPGSGRNHGESVEQDWPATNLVATSTREMSPAARRETLNDHWGSWNWCKVCRIAHFLARSLKTAIESQHVHAERLKQFSRIFKESLINEWKQMILEWNRDPSRPDPYTEDSSTTITYNGVKADMLKEDASEMQLGEFPAGEYISSSQFLLAGLELEEQQRLLIALRNKHGRDPTPTMMATLQERRNTLMRRIDTWRQLQERHMPIAISILSSLPAPTTLNVEDLPLLLPSALSDDQRSTIPALVGKEARLREALADDSLSELRRHLRVRHALYQYKKIHVRGSGQAPNTRTSALMAQQTAKIDKCAARYRAAYTALLTLKPGGSWTLRLLPLENGHIRHPADGDSHDGAVREGVGRLGEGKRDTRSWIWLSSPVSPTGRMVQYDANDEEVDSSLRVEWTKSFARSQRWDEEVQLLASEMQRVVLFFEWKQRWWREFIGARDKAGAEVAKGADAYAEEQADGLRRLAEDCALKWIPILKSAGLTYPWFTRYETSLHPPPSSILAPVTMSSAIARTTPLQQDSGAREGDAESDAPEDSEPEEGETMQRQSLDERVAALRLAAYNE